MNVSPQARFSTSLTVIRCALLAGVVAVFAACSDSTAPVPEDLEPRDQWAKVGPASYAYEFNWICFCTFDFIQRVRITVVDGTVTTIIDAESQEPVAPESVSYYRTIDGLFDLIDEAVGQEAFKINVTYDEDLGYPVSADIDYSEMVVDEEMAFQVHELIPID